MGRETSVLILDLGSVDNVLNIVVLPRGLISRNKEISVKYTGAVISLTNIKWQM
jgi:hypothetical protein